MVSVCAAVAAGCEIVSKKAPWREKSNAHYARRDQISALIKRLKYEIPTPPTEDQIAMISREYRETLARYGTTMNAINARQDGGSIA
jgi:hypothetical protein